MSEQVSYKKDVEKRAADEEKLLAESEAKKEEQFSLTDIWAFYHSNEVGDSLLYNRIHRNRFAYNVVTTQWYSYKDPHWVEDDDGEALAVIEKVVEQYFRLIADLDTRIGQADSKGEATRLIKQKGMVRKRIERLRTSRGRRSLLDCCVSNGEPLTFRPDDMDKMEWLFAAKNCVINLKSGEKQDSNPKDYLTLASPIEWKDEKQDCPEFKKFLNDVLDGNQEVIDFLQRVLGYAITGLNTERFFIVLFGKHGQNGKGTLMEILYHVLGDLSWPIQSEMLMSQKFSRSSSGPSPDIMSLKGKRMVWGSETEEGQSFAAGRLKKFSGGDPLTGRGLHDKKETSFMPSHSLFLLTNNLPHAPAHDNAFWERIKVIDFPFSFVDREPDKPHERKADRKLMERLKEESVGILSWLVRGCMMWQKQDGLGVPRKVRDDSLKYRRTEDDLQDFLEQCCVVDMKDITMRVASSDLYGRYKTWWADQSSSRPMSNKKFSDVLGRKGFEKLKSSKRYFLGVRIKIEDQGDFK